MSHDSAHIFVPRFSSQESIGGEAWSLEGDRTIFNALRYAEDAGYQANDGLVPADTEVLWASDFREEGSGLKIGEIVPPVVADLEVVVNARLQRTNLTGTPKGDVLYFKDSVSSLRVYNETLGIAWDDAGSVRHDAGAVLIENLWSGAGFDSIDDRGDIVNVATLEDTDFLRHEDLRIGLRLYIDAGASIPNTARIRADRIFIQIKWNTPGSPYHSRPHGIILNPDDEDLVAS